MSSYAGMPDWRQLVANMSNWAVQTGDITARSLEDQPKDYIMEIVVKAVGAERLAEFLKRSLDWEPTLPAIHRIAAVLPFCAAFTTNPKGSSPGSAGVAVAV